MHARLRAHLTHVKSCTMFAGRFLHNPQKTKVFAICPPCSFEKILRYTDLRLMYILGHGQLHAQGPISFEACTLPRACTILRTSWVFLTLHNDPKQLITKTLLVNCNTKLNRYHIVLIPKTSSTRTIYKPVEVTFKAFNRSYL